MNNANIQVENNQQNDEQVLLNQPLPQYGQVQGSRIYLSGLDYTLLKSLVPQNAQKKLLNLQSINKKLQSLNKQITNRIPLKPISTMNQNSIFLINKLKNLKTSKPLVNNTIYYVFDCRMDGRIRPQVVSKRFGRVRTMDEMYKIKDDFGDKFRKALLIKTNIRDKSHKIDLLLNITDKNKESQSVIDQEDSDDIFGANSQSEEQSNQKPSIPLFSFGKGLHLGVSNQQIFKPQSLKRPSPQQELLPNEPVQQGSSKYSFLPKKIKPSLQGQTDGYNECYYQSGPSLDQMKEYRSQGIQYWGDLKEAPKKAERKVNIHREYDKVKKIIDEKYGKK